MSLEELAALGCTNRSPAKALKLHDRERDSSFKDRIASIRASQAKNPARTGVLARELGPAGYPWRPRVGRSEELFPRRVGRLTPFLDFYRVIRRS